MLRRKPDGDLTSVRGSCRLCVFVERVTPVAPEEKIRGLG